jgi:hypothetical protein
VVSMVGLICGVTAVCGVVGCRVGLF